MSTCNCCNKPCTHTVYYTPLIRVGQVDFTVCKSGVLISDRIAPIEGIDNNYIKFQTIDPTIVGADISLKNGTSFYTGPYGSITFPKTTITSINSSANVANLAGTFTGNGFVDAVEFQYITQPDDYINGIDCYTLNPMGTPFKAGSGYFTTCNPKIDIANLQIDPCSCDKLYPIATGIHIYDGDSLEINDDTSYVGRDTLDYNSYHSSCKEGKYYRVFLSPAITASNPVFINHYDSGSTSIIYQKYKNIYGGFPCYYASGIQSGNLITPVDKYSQKLDVFIFGPTYAYTKFRNRNFNMSCSVDFCDDHMYFNNAVNPVYTTVSYNPCSQSATSQPSNSFDSKLYPSGKLQVDFNKDNYNAGGNYFYPIVFDLFPPKDQDTLDPNRANIKLNSVNFQGGCSASTLSNLSFNANIVPSFSSSNPQYSDTISCSATTTFFSSQINISNSNFNINPPNELNGWKVKLRYGGGAIQSPTYPVQPISYVGSWSKDPINGSVGSVIATLFNEYYLTGGSIENFYNDLSGGLNYNNCGTISCKNLVLKSINPSFNKIKSIKSIDATVVSEFGYNIQSILDDLWNNQKKIGAWFDISASVGGSYHIDCYGNTLPNFSFGLSAVVNFFVDDRIASFAGNQQSVIVFIDPNGKEYLPINQGYPYYYGACSFLGIPSFSIG